MSLWSALKHLWHFEGHFFMIFDQTGSDVNHPTSLHYFWRSAFCPWGIDKRRSALLVCWPRSVAMGAARSRPGCAPALCARLRFARLLANPQHYCGVSRSVLAVDHSVSKQICRDPDTSGRLVCHAADLISQCRGTPLSGGPRVRTRSTSISLQQSIYNRSTPAR